ncbi:MAG: nucleotide sugar dehydrogenase [Planctomycetota bacterium]|nr:MAG: nucleotide sugar dehydrogenase [Planctomycetota bacterium]
MDLLEKIRSKRAKVGIIGLGYVGLPLAKEFCQAGFPVLGFDIDSKKIQSLQKGQSYIHHIPIQPLVEGNFQATDDFRQLSHADAILICVPTPLNKHREPDISYVRNTASTIAQHLRPQQLIVLESTTYPGTTDELLRPILQEKQFKVGTDFHLAYSPEREDPNNPIHSTRTIPKVVGGCTPKCRELACELYQSIVETVVPVSSPKVAEATKLLENIYRAVNIALVNELKMLFDRMDINIWEVIEAAATKPFGFQPFYPGPGLGGHCIPIDPFYLTWKAREYDVRTRFIELAGEINTYMPYYVIQKATEALNQQKKSLHGSKILVLGLAYKKDIDDPRESPAFKVIELLQAQKAQVDYNDPFIPQTPPMRHYRLDMRSIPLCPQNLAHYDLVIVITDHSQYDADFLLQHAKLILDTRNLIPGSHPKVVRA